jgi:glycerol-3-phosphate dehydrogenase
MRKLRGKTTSHGERVDCVVVGAGVLGLAAARALARAGREVIVLEANAAIGTEISSRNSGVIHAGIYYPKDSVKASKSCWWQPTRASCPCCGRIRSGRPETAWTICAI